MKIGLQNTVSNAQKHIQHISSREDVLKISNGVRVSYFKKLHVHDDSTAPNKTNRNQKK